MSWLGTGKWNFWKQTLKLPWKPLYSSFSAPLLIDFICWLSHGSRKVEASWWPSRVMSESLDKGQEQSWLQSYLITKPAFPWSRPMIKPWLFIVGVPTFIWRRGVRGDLALKLKLTYHITLRENTVNCRHTPDGFSGCHSLTCILRWQMLVSVHLASNTHKLDFALETGWYCPSGSIIKNKVCRPSSFSPRNWISGRWKCEERTVRLSQGKFQVIWVWPWCFLVVKP